jgi:type VI secretion system secreted protein Hcp
VSTGGSGGEDRLTENISINFGEVKFEYTVQKQDGTAGGVVPFGYNLKANKLA